MSVESGIGRFAPQAERLETAILSIDPALEYEQKIEQLEQIPSYISHGTTFAAFHIPEESLVLKLGLGTHIAEQFDADEQAKEARRTVTALKRGTGLEYVEQLHSYTLEGTPIVITHYMPGATVGDTEHANLPISRRPYEQLVDTWRAMKTRKITPDDSPFNVMYSFAYQEFGVIDYHTDEEADLPRDMNEMATTFAQFILPHSTARPTPALVFRDVCHQQLGAEIARNVTEIIDESTDFYRGAASVL